MFNMDGLIKVGIHQFYGIEINDFAYRTFRWDSEANWKAHVHCVIVGFSTIHNNKPKKLYSSENFQFVKNISPYLISADNIFIESRRMPLCDVPEMARG